MGGGVREADTASRTVFALNKNNKNSEKVVVTIGGVCCAGGKTRHCCAEGLRELLRLSVSCQGCLTRTHQSGQSLSLENIKLYKPPKWLMTTVWRLRQSEGCWCSWPKELVYLRHNIQSFNHETHTGNTVGQDVLYWYYPNRTLNIVKDVFVSKISHESLVTVKHPESNTEHFTE